MRRADSSNPFGSDGAAARLRHVIADGAEHVVAHPKSLPRPRPASGVSLVHREDQLGLPVIDAGLADRVEGDVGHRDRRPGTISGICSVKAIGRARVKRRGEPGHEARAVVARAVGRLAELDRVLRLEMAARRVIVRARERNERGLAFLVEAAGSCRAGPDAGPNPRSSAIAAKRAAKRSGRAMAREGTGFVVEGNCRSARARSPRRRRRAGRRRAISRWSAARPRRGPPPSWPDAAARALAEGVGDRCPSLPWQFLRDRLFSA